MKHNEFFSHKSAHNAWRYKMKLIFAIKMLHFMALI